MTTRDEIKYGVCALIDLQGFSSHLEIGADLRTTIGQQALDRLDNLEQAIKLVRNEKKNHRTYYSGHIHIQRINDSLIVTMDLPKMLIPNIGEKGPYSYTKGVHDELKNGMITRNIRPEKDPMALFHLNNEIRNNSTHSLSQFVGLIARIHGFIRQRESESFLPGPKTVIATGYRKSYTVQRKEDFLSANFAFSNAYLAEKDLRGAGFFVDDIIIRLLFTNEFSRTLMRYALFILEEMGIDPSKDGNDLFTYPGQWEIGKEIPLTLLRKKYWFRPLNPHPLVLAQILPALEPFLSEKKTPIRITPVLKSAFAALKSKKTLEQIRENPSGILHIPIALDKDIHELMEDMVNADPNSNSYKINTYNY